MVSIDLIKAKIETPLWIIGLFSTVIFVFRAGGLYHEVKSDLELIKKTSANVKALISSHSDVINRIEILETAAENQHTVNVQIMENINRYSESRHASH